MPIELRGRLGARPPRHLAQQLAANGPASRREPVLANFNLDPGYIRDLSQLHERDGLDGILIPQRGYTAEVLSLASWVLAATHYITVVASHRPGLQSPTLAARAFATLDHLSGGRISLHIIQSRGDIEQQRDGDFLSKDDRYRRAGEYLTLFRRTLEETQPFDYKGEFYEVKEAYSQLKPTKRPFLTAAGASDAGIAFVAQHADGYAFYSEPLKETEELVSRVRREAAAQGRGLKFWRDTNFVLARTDERARAKVEAKAKALKEKFGDAEPGRSSGSVGWQRVDEIADKSDWHDRALFTGLWKVGGGGPPFVGTPATAAAAVLDYYALGIELFSVGFDGDDEEDAELKAELFQRIRVGAADIDQRGVERAVREH